MDDNSDDTDKTIVDAEVVEENVVPDEAQLNPVPGAATRLLDLEKSIRTYYQSLQSKREDLKKNRDIVNDALLQDKLYEEQQYQADELKRKMIALREQVMNIPSVRSAREEMKELSQEIKDMQKTLSKFLLEYRRLANTNQIQVTDGEFFEIVEDAKLVKARSK
ncbi:hypothetical protein A2690_04315 [Candidatus Roizmanbacteria bacterium RIFCSPHIGHO2_01_FULL_39_12b]|uniref:Uncharacterized protein n=1 Tax=Candidatus Roizmanbacteria bacterium RIFCSPHIGHO2_01_FULL_39_12b TaxID=1802030 RepID=A0A1F7GCN5_9BACT|nr:MAG: hypothetical protein A2690_04315 [Candidatus Roizmanbacteria bacterium RIFCSPHIGHO2_01_FULL_39_12b]OGK47165.1 MAG: hypothetical protein A3B46_02040 [Candidatus Roizmanbacteria bacterium RIFCSPLOWO2_01_FULL_39_19]